MILAVMPFGVMAFFFKGAQPFSLTLKRKYNLNKTSAGRSRKAPLGVRGMGFFNKLFGKKEKESLDEGLKKTKEGFFAKITKAIAGKSSVDEEVLDDLEEALVRSLTGLRKG
jgi:fused signal recognition particle receptor